MRVFHHSCLNGFFGIILTELVHTKELVITVGLNAEILSAIFKGIAEVAHTSIKVFQVKLKI